MSTERLIRAAQNALGELDRLKVAYALGLECDVEPPSFEITQELRDAIVATIRPAPNGEQKP